MTRIIVVTLVAALVGCATHAQTDQDAFFTTYLTALDQEVAAGQRTPTSAARLARAKAAELFSDPYLDEIWAYRVTLAQDVEKGALTNDQADYLNRQKTNEVTARAQGRSPTVTNCRPDGLGGVRCVSR